MTFSGSGIQQRRKAAVQTAMSIPGWMWPRELNWLSTAFSKSQLHVEIGSYAGRSLYASAAGMPHGSRLIAVDPLRADIEADWIRSVLKATIDMTRRKLPAQVEHWEESSVSAMSRFAAGSMQADSVFIDGLHWAAAVKADIEGWLPLIKPGGIIAGHDYWPQDPGVMDAVNELLPAFNVVDDTRIWWSRV